MPDLKLNIDTKFERTLQDLVPSSSGAKNEADIVQRAVATYKYLKTDLPKGAKIQVVDDAGNTIEADLQLP
jgi:hypothetical protein